MAKKNFNINAILEAGKNAHLSDNFIDVRDGNSVDGEVFIKLPIDDIEPNPLQPRKSIREDELQELIKSIKLHGLIHPITVVKVSDKKQVLLAGQRRLMAYRYMGEKEIPAIIREDERVKNLEKLEMLNDTNISKLLFEISVSENETREALSPLELAISIDEVLKKKIYNSINEVAQVLGKSKAYISKIHSTIKLAPPILEDIKNTRAVGHIEALYELQKIKDEKLQVDLYHKLKAGEINIDNIKAHSVIKKNSRSPYDFKVTKNRVQLAINTQNIKNEDREAMQNELQALIDKYIKKP